MIIIESECSDEGSGLKDVYLLLSYEFMLCSSLCLLCLQLKVRYMKKYIWSLTPVPGTKLLKPLEFPE